MPVKRSTVAVIRLELADWLLDGHVRHSDDSDPLRSTAVYDSFLEFDTPEPDLRALWQQHRAWLLTEWARRGRVGQPWAAREFDAANAHDGRQKATDAIR